MCRIVMVWDGTLELSAKPSKLVPLIDLSAIPVAAPGSDADLIGRGEMRDR
jgi:hypothetical protein